VADTAVTASVSAAYGFFKLLLLFLSTPVAFFCFVLLPPLLLLGPVDYFVLEMFFGCCSRCQQLTALWPTRPSLLLAAPLMVALLAVALVVFVAASCHCFLSPLVGCCSCCHHCFLSCFMFWFLAVAITAHCVVADMAITASIGITKVNCYAVVVSG